MLFSIIIPTCNRNDLLSKCLDLLSPENQTFDADLFELIISDDSKDGKASELTNGRYNWAKWSNGPKKGPAANRNNGAKQAKGEWLIFIDDDCLPDKNLLNAYYAGVKQNPNVKVFEGCIKADREQQSLIEESPVNETGGYLWSCNFMIEKNLFNNTLHGFDENFPYAAMEDVDLHYRLQLNKVPVLFLPGAFVVHPWRSQNKMVSITLKRFKSILYFIDKHPEKRKELNSLYFLRVFYQVFIKNTVRNAMKFNFRGFFPKVTHDFMQISFAFYTLFRRPESIHQKKG